MKYTKYIGGQKAAVCMIALLWGVMASQASWVYSNIKQTLFLLVRSSTILALDSSEDINN